MYAEMRTAFDFTNRQRRLTFPIHTEIDLRDGSLDHRYRSPLLDCPDCGKKVNARTRVCAYCGFKDLPVDVFEMP